MPEGSPVMVRPMSLAVSDFEHFREHLKDWDTHPTQLSPGPFRLTWDYIGLGDLALGRIRFNQRVLEVSAYDDKLCFTVCQTRAVFCGVEIPAGSIVRMGPGRDYHDILDGPWDSLAFFVSRTLADSLRIAPSGSEFQALAPDTNVHTLAKRQIAEFRSFADAVSDVCSATDIVDETWAPAIRARALALLTAAQDFPRSGTRERIRVSQVHGYGLTAAALDVIERHEREQSEVRLKVSDVAAALGVSSRALVYAFNAVFGMSIYQFMLAQRLSRVRDRLAVAANVRAAVTDAAFLYDFGHLSRFASAYRRLFGELPSETLRRASPVGRVAAPQAMFDGRSAN
jgi:AraC family ethanolamine operon transcriptional activator